MDTNTIPATDELGALPTGLYAQIWKYGGIAALSCFSITEAAHSRWIRHFHMLIIAIHELAHNPPVGNRPEFQTTSSLSS
jgi:hypothetical protein